MNWFIPREHGAWAMLIVPFVIGMFASEISVYHFIFFIGVLAFYFASGPFLAYIRKPSLKKAVLPALFIYITVGCLFSLPVLYKYPTVILIGLFIVPFFALNIYFAKQKKERLFVNDLLAIIALSFLVLISYYIGNGLVDERALLLMVINILFFTASVFHVKTLIRERGNRAFLWISHLFHLFTIVIFIPFQLMMVAVAFLIGGIKTFVMPKKQYKPLKIGIIEIINSVLFVIIIGYFY